MGRLAEALIFLTLAAALHLAAFAMPGPGGRAELGGTGGKMAVAMQAAPDQMTELLEKWDSVPDTAPSPEQPAPSFSKP